MREQSPKDAKNGTPASRMDGRKFLPVDCTEEAAYNEGRKKQVNQAEMEEGAELCDGVEAYQNRKSDQWKEQIKLILAWAVEQSDDELKNLLYVARQELERQRSLQTP